MAGHVEDRWTKVNKETGRRVRTDRYGRGLRWKARFPLPTGRERTKAHATKDAAEKWIARLSVQEGDYIDPRAGAILFRDYAAQWLANQVHQRPGTRESAALNVRRANEVIGDRPMASLRRSDIQHLITVKCATLAPGTVRQVAAYVGAVFRSAVEDKVIAASPCTSLKYPEMKRVKVQPLTVEQIAEIARRVPPRYRAMVIVAAATGMRSGELRGLTVDRITPPLHVRSQIAPASVTLRVDRQMVGRKPDGSPLHASIKTTAGDRSVQIGGTATQALIEHLTEFGTGAGGVVFSTDKGWALEDYTASGIWKAAISERKPRGDDPGWPAMDLSDRSGWHACRHFQASLLIKAGRSPRAVADRLGHADPSETLRVYSHLWDVDESESVNMIETALAGI